MNLIFEIGQKHEAQIWIAFQIIVTHSESAAIRLRETAGETRVPWMPNYKDTGKILDQIQMKK